MWLKATSSHWWISVRGTARRTLSLTSPREEREKKKKQKERWPRDDFPQMERVLKKLSPCGQKQKQKTDKTPPREWKKVKVRLVFFFFFFLRRSPPLNPRNQQCHLHKRRLMPLKIPTVFATRGMFGRRLGSRPRASLCRWRRSTRRSKRRRRSPRCPISPLFAKARAKRF